MTALLAITFIGLIGLTLLYIVMKTLEFAGGLLMSLLSGIGAIVGMIFKGAFIVIGIIVLSAIHPLLGLGAILFIIANIFTS